jgi:hypothetical protein
VSFAAITLFVASQRAPIVFIVVVYFVIDSVRRLLDIPSYPYTIDECHRQFVRISCGSLRRRVCNCTLREGHKGRV